ncbi:uncharacterized protein LOC114769487 [Denticeps clupeoides]|uniref:uncharacterized protein LOC114769487 n=1 Tax=Denticeps clupeoides TaxID=299321 RepID=UPI0010A4A103|nr:uncharacterized protein LOC114769487 [Denticeps clupeoides]
MAPVYRVAFLLLYMGASVYFGSLGSTMSVFQSPENITAAAGSTVGITCTPSWDYEYFKVMWDYGGTRVNVSAMNLLSSRFNASSPCKKKCTLTIKDATTTDSGWYFCQVKIEIPVVKTARGNGTQVTIHASSFSSGDPVVPAAAAATGCCLVIAVIAVCAIWRRRLREDRENPVYDNVQVTNRHATGKDLAATTASRNQQMNHIYVNMHAVPRRTAQARPAVLTSSGGQTPAYHNVRDRSPARSQATCQTSQQ